MRSVLQMSLAATPLICGITLARTLLRRRISPRVFLLLWSLAVCRLLAPLWVPVRKATVKPLLNHVYGGIFNVTRQAVALLDDRFLFFAWLLGAFVALAYMVRVHLKSSLQWREAVPMESPVAQAWCAEQTGCRRIEVFQTDRTGAPFSIGVLRPRIIFPSKMIFAPEKALRQILAHEEAHLRAFHPLAKYFLLAACCVHWFNPFVWLMLFLCGQDMELAADERALRGQSLEEKKAYADMLNDMAKCPMGLGLMNEIGSPSLKERTQVLEEPQKLSKGLTFLIALLGIILFYLLIAAPPKVDSGLVGQHPYYGENAVEYYQRLSDANYDILSIDNN